MPHLSDELDQPRGGSPRKLPSTFSKAAVYVEAAAFYVACLRAGYGDEAQEFQEWFLDTFDIDLED